MRAAVAPGTVQVVDAMSQTLERHDQQEKTGLGNYFVANYPPFSFWKPAFLPDAKAALDRPPVPGTPLGLYLQSALPRDIIARMLRNLKEIHRAQEDWQRLIAVQDRLVILMPEAWGEWRDRGLAHAEQGHATQAVRDLETYLAHAKDALDIDAITERVAGLRRARY